MINRLIRVASPVLLILLIPLIAMQYTSEVTWTPSDFVFAGGLLFSTGLVIDLALSGGRALPFRIGALIAILSTFLLVWTNLAVGLIGSEDSPVNALYLSVLAILIWGSILVRFKPRGLAAVLFLAALTHVLVPVAGMLVWGAEIVGEVARAVGVTAFFAILFVASGLCFRWAWMEEATV